MNLTPVQRATLVGYFVSRCHQDDGTVHLEFWAGTDQQVNHRTVDSLVALGLVIIVSSVGPPSNPRSQSRVRLTDEGVRVRTELLETWPQSSGLRRA